jgi:hypothetical protein
MRLLDGAVAERHVVEREELTVVSNRGLGPQALQDAEVLVEAPAAGRLGNP